ncbi:uncharacterized protein TNCV_300661 [Trichonephila clavipes]|nr:uncharacterized protein TNCV_300661 [Trichonephila clavipes]
MMSHSARLGKKSDDLESPLGYNNGMRVHFILLEDTSFNNVHKCQHKTLNHQIDVQVYSQGEWNNYMNAPAIVENCSLEHNVKCRTSVSRPQRVVYRR